MSKKKRQATETGPTDLLSVRVQREREWCYAGWLAHKTWTQLRIEANLPEGRGGLGYDLSIQAIKGLVEQARAERGDLHLDRDAHIERELNDLDLVQQLAAVELRRAAEAPHGGWLHEKAAKLYLDVGVQRRKLLGLDEATKIDATVVHRDAVTEELNAMLARAGQPPIEVPDAN